MLKATQDAPLSPSKNKSSLKASNGPTINLGQFFNSQAAAPMDTSLEVTTVSAAKKRPPSVQTQSSYPQKTSKMEVDHPNKSNPEGACPMETSAKGTSAD